MSATKNLPRNILIALFLGSMVGLFLPQIAPYVSFLGLAFRLSLGMIVMPILLTSILGGLEAIGDVRKLGGLGTKTLVFFLATTLLAVVLGLGLVNLIEPGIRPAPKEIAASINAINENDPKKTVDQIIQAVTNAPNIRLSDTKLLDFKTNMTELVRGGADSLEVKEGALQFYGSLELRSMLEKDKRPNQITNISWHDFFKAQITQSIVNPFKALNEGNVMAVILFILLLGGALTTIGPKAQKVFEFNDALGLALTKIVEMLMRFAPFGVFGLIADVIASTGIQVFRELGLYALCVVAGLMIHLFLFLPLINYFYTKQGPAQFFSAMRPALLVAFSTSSSNATLPITIQCAEKNLGVDQRIARFVLPLGATMNMNGTALYEAVAAVFIAQLYGMSLGFFSTVIVALTAAIAAIGAAGIPAAGTVTMVLVLSAVGLPIEGIGLLLAIDRPLDMFRTAVNVAGDAIGAHVLNPKGQKALQPVAPETASDKASLA